MAISDRQVLWTALPAGIVNGFARLSVYVSPRLTPPPPSNTAPPAVTLGGPISPSVNTTRYPEFLHWAALAPLTFQVELGDGKKYTASVAEHRQPALWDALFPAKTPVETFTFTDFSKWDIVTPPVSALSQYILSTYQSVAAQTPTDTPNSAALTKLFNGSLLQMGDKGEHYGPLNQIRRWLNDRASNPKASSPLSSPVLNQLAQMYTFLKPSWPAATLPTAPTPTGLARPTVPVLEFHQILASLASYPQVLRWLGIVFDLTLDAAGTAALKNSNSVRVLPTRTGGAGVDKSPWTAYGTMAANGFAATPLPGTPNVPGTPNASDFTADGLLAVDQPRYGILPLDATGAAVNLCNFVEQITARERNPQDQAGLPALRSAGLSLVADGRSTDVASVFKSASNNNASLAATTDGGNITVGAAEVMRGVRVDVWDAATQIWTSLCNRTYQLTGITSTPVTDEGTLTTSATQHGSTTGSAGELHMVESLFRWMGSGLCVPPPGAPPAEKQGSLQIKLTTPPASSPQLLFGHGYRFRVRRVDLAGNSVAANDPSIAKTPHITALSTYWTAGPVPGGGTKWFQNVVPTRYLRFEPVVAPTLRPTVAATSLHGESTGVLAVRTPATPAPGPVNCTRRVDPPAAAGAVLLQHGLSPAQIKTPHLPDLVTPPTPKNPSKVVVYDKKRDTFNLAVPKTPLLDYTPDPLAVGASFRVSANGTFPNLQTIAMPAVPNANQGPLLLTLVPVAASVAPSAVLTPPSAASGNLATLTVSLPPASILKLRLSSTLNAAGVELLALWDVTKQAFGKSLANDPLALNGKLSALLNQATQGLLPMLTPYREITLVHALEKPLAPALVNGFHCQARTPNQTSAYLVGGIQSDRNSTSKVDVAATWMEWVDVAPAAPAQVQHEVHVISSTVAITGPQFDPIGGADLPCHQEFGDTAYRQVTYQPIASTRFAEYFEPSAQVPDPDQQQTGPAISLSILNSARPPAPHIRYIMPTFRWTRIDQDGRVVSRRIGGGFRVFLDRPWYSSGDGELLAVVVADPTSQLKAVSNPVVGTGPAPPLGQLANAYPVPALEHYVTSIGGDPLSVSAGPSHDISSNNFLNGTNSIPGGLVLPEAPTAKIDVVGYPVHWSDAHQCWCADIHVDPYTNQADKKHHFGYMPFVRFALARYQPNSIGGYEVSPVVRMDPVQSVPDRMVEISPAPGSPPNQPALHLTIRVTGELAKQSSTISTVEVYLEATLSGAASPKSEVDWVTIPNAIVQTPATGQLYVGIITLPSPRGSRGFRVVVKETEFLPSDKRTPARVVYADAVPL